MLFSPDCPTPYSRFDTAGSALPKKVQMVMILPCSYKENPLTSKGLWRLLLHKKTPELNKQPGASGSPEVPATRGTLAA
jgi:hypothetical protein